MSKPSIKELIFQDLKEAVKGLSEDQIKIEISKPALESHGDYSTNVSLALAKKLGKNPMEVAQELASGVKTLASSYLEKVEVAPPGFINFFISREYLLKNLEEAKKEKFGSGKSLENKKIMVEFTDPNPFKEFHIGHLYSNTVGESISRLLEATGAEVRRVCYQGDVGMHVAKAIYGMREKLKSEKLELKSLEGKSLEERAKFLGESYALGASEFDENENAKVEIISFNKKIFDKSYPEINELYDKGKAWSLEYFEAIYKRLGTKFDKLYFESETGVVGFDLVNEYKNKGIFEESEGAVIFPGKKFGLHNRVFINSHSLPTYEAKELGLAPTKYKDYPYDQSIIITGNEVNEYFKVVLKALSLINPDLAERSKHISHGMVRLPEGKMSSRKGNILTGEWMLNEARDKITQKYENVIPEVAEKVAVGAVKYALLKSGIGRDVEFSFEQSISLEGNSGPYLQYTYARTHSVLEKSQITNDKLQINTKNGNNWKFEIGNLKLEIEELQVLRTLLHYPEAVEEAASKFAPNLVCNYLFDLAQKFNLFYQKHKIIDSDQEEFRISLTSAVGLVLSSGLTLLGIPVVEKM